jgi:hypothetical protein
MAVATAVLYTTLQNLNPTLDEKKLADALIKEDEFQRKGGEVNLIEQIISLDQCCVRTQSPSLSCEVEQCLPLRRRLLFLPCTSSTAQ